MNSFTLKPLILSTLIMIVLAPTISNASSFDINFHDDTIGITYATYTTKDIITDGGALFINQKDTSEQVFHLGINKSSKNVRFGVRGIYTSPDNLDVLALGVGLNARFYPSKKTRLDIGGYYAPELTSLMDATGFTEIDFRFSFNISEPLDLYIGYRNIKVEIEKSVKKIALDDDMHIGFKFYF